MKITTRSVHFTADQKLLDYIETKLSKVEKYYDRVVEANVVLKLENSGQIKDKIVDLRVKVPGHVLVSSRENKTFEKAFDEALSNTKRQLRKYKEKLKSKH